MTRRPRALTARGGNTPQFHTVSGGVAEGRDRLVRCRRRRARATFDNCRFRFITAARRRQRYYSLRLYNIIIIYNMLLRTSVSRPKRSVRTIVATRYNKKNNNNIIIT